MPVNEAAAKAELRSRVRTSRAARTADDRARAGTALAATLLAMPQIATARVVAAYFGVRREPPTTEFLDAVITADRRVLLPILRDDGDLDWADFTRQGKLTEGPLGLHEPTGPPLGVDAIASADVVIVPALAVDRAGRRLGQGGGGYDRALRRVPAGVHIIAVVFDDELVDEVPVEGHDVVVTMAVTPSRVVAIGPDTTNGPVLGG